MKSFMLVLLAATTITITVDGKTQRIDPSEITDGGTWAVPAVTPPVKPQAAPKADKLKR